MSRRKLGMWAVGPVLRDQLLLVGQLCADIDQFLCLLEVLQRSVQGGSIQRNERNELIRRCHCKGSYLVPLSANESRSDNLCSVEVGQGLPVVRIEYRGQIAHRHRAREIQRLI